jgi:DNA-binding SARP family transcriptional activator
VTFLLLGPVEVRIGPRSMPLFGRRQRRTLAALLLDADRVVQVDRLVDVVWDVAPPSTARRQIQDLVTRLRRDLTTAGAARDTIVTAGGGYVLRLDGHELDTRRFTALVEAANRIAQNDHAAAAADLRAALELWRGPAMAGSSDGALAPAAAALNERRLAVWEDVLRIELDLGRHRDLIGELAALVDQQPYRESAVGLLMLALSRDGRQAEALAAYEALRRRLADELGIDPGGDLQRTHRAILRSDAHGSSPADGARVAPVVPAQLPADVTPFTGRAEQIGRLDALVPGQDGRPNAVVISAIAGAAGIGKTALAVHWAHRVRAAFPDGQLYVNLSGYAPAPPVRPIAALTRLLNTLGVAPEHVPDHVEEAAALYRSHLAGRRILVVLDNAGHADQVRPLLPGSGGCLALITSRDSLRGLIARDGAHRLTLDALTPAESRALLATLVGPERVDAEPAAADELARLCAHLPLALRIAAAILADHPERSIAGYAAELRAGDRLAALQVDGDERAAVRAAFDLSYAVQPDAARRVFRLLGLVPGADIGTEAAAALAGIPTGHAGALLRQLTDAHVIDQTAPGRYALHDLLRLYAAERAAAEDSRAERESAIGRLYEYYLNRADAGAVRLYPEKLRLPLPGPRSSSPLPVAPAFADHGEALAWLDAERPNLVAAVAHAAEHGPRSAAWLLADILRGYFWLRMYTLDWRSVATAALAAATAEGDLNGQAAARLSLADSMMLQSRYADAIAHYRRALVLHRRSGSLRGQSTALGNLGNVYWRSGRLRTAAEHFAEGLALDRQTGWLAGQGVKLGNLGSVYRALGRLDQSVEHHTQALAIDRASGSASGEAIELADLGEAYHALGRFDEAAAHVARALELQREIGDRVSEAESLRILAAIHRDTGRSGLDLAIAALELAQATGERRIEADALNTLATIHHRLGRDDLALDNHHEALRVAGLADSPYTELEALVGLGTVHAGLGEQERATEHVGRALAASRRAGYRLLEGQALATRALVRFGRRRYVQAIADARQALAIHEEAGHRLGAARAHRLLGRALGELGRPDAADHVRRALALFGELGAPEDAPWSGPRPSGHVPESSGT